MNIAKIILNLNKKFLYIKDLIIFKLIKKPLWVSAFNKNGNIFECNGTLIKTKISMWGENNKIKIGEGNMQNVKILINGIGNEFIIDNNFIIRDGAFIRITGNNSKIIIGSNFDLAYALIAADDSSSIYIGDNCLLSNKIVIRSADGHIIMDQNTGQRINFSKDIHIDNHVWIGYGVTVLKGSHIESNSVLGSESLISNQIIPRNSIAVGMPAKIIKNNIIWEK